MMPLHASSRLDERLGAAARCPQQRWAGAGRSTSATAGPPREVMRSTDAVGSRMAEAGCEPARSVAFPRRCAPAASPKLDRLASNAWALLDEALLELGLAGSRKRRLLTCRPGRGGPPMRAAGGLAECVGQRGSRRGRRWRYSDLGSSWALSKDGRRSSCVRLLGDGPPSQCAPAEAWKRRLGPSTSPMAWRPNGVHEGRSCALAGSRSPGPEEGPEAILDVPST